MVGLGEVIVVFIVSGTLVVFSLHVYGSEKFEWLRRLFMRKKGPDLEMARWYGH